MGRRCAVFGVEDAVDVRGSNGRDRSRRACRRCCGPCLEKAVASTPTVIAARRRYVAGPGPSQSFALVAAEAKIEILCGREPGGGLDCWPQHPAHRIMPAAMNLEGGPDGGGVNRVAIGFALSCRDRVEGRIDSHVGSTISPARL